MKISKIELSTVNNCKYKVKKYINLTNEQYETFKEEDKNVDIKLITEL